MGKECSGYFSAGSAQYHISGDIAYSIVSYYLVTKNLDFIAEKGAEIVFETARMIKTIERSFAYYEKVTTHDSSLSTCIYSIVWLIYEGSRILVKVNGMYFDFGKRPAEWPGCSTGRSIRK